MAITISGENNNDRILAQDGVIDQISGINIVGLITASHINVGSNIQLGNAGIITATTFVGNVTGNVNSTSPLLLQTGGSERIRLTSNNEIGIAGANYGSSGQVLTSGGSGSAVSWTTIPTQVTIANNADNRVITGGSGTNLAAESSFTYNAGLLIQSNSNGNVQTQMNATSGDAKIVLDNSGDGNYSGIDFERQRQSGPGVNGGSIFMKSDTSSNNAYLYLQAQSASAQSPVTTALSDGNGVRLILKGGTGIFSVESGASERLRITSGGAVQISGADDQDNLLVKAGNTHFAVHQDDTDGEVSLRAQDGSGSNNSKYMTFFTNPSGSAATERLRIKSDGIIETGTAIGDSAYDGNQRLRVGRTGDCSISIRANGSTTAATGLDFGDDDDDRAGRIQYVHNGNYMSFHTNGAGTGNANEQLRIYSNGAVLIGAHSGEAGGDAKLAIDCQGMDIYDGVGDASNYGLIFANDPTTNKANGIGFFNDSASTCGGYIVHQDRGSGNIGDLLFGTSSTSDTPVERLRISSSGHVGINYGVNPNRYLQVRTIDGAAHNGVFAGENVNESNGATMFFLSTFRDSSSSEKFMQFNRDQNNSNQGVAAVFDVLTNGNVRNSNNSYSSISDVKLKENIIDASSQWDDIKNLRVRKFNFKSTPSETLIGVVAQEIETISPGLVDDIPDMDLTKEGHEGTSTKSVKYSVLYMKAIKCLQEAQARIETLEAKVSALEG